MIGQIWRPITTQFLQTLLTELSNQIFYFLFITKEKVLLQETDIGCLARHKMSQAAH